MIQKRTSRLGLTIEAMVSMHIPPFGTAAKGNRPSLHGPKMDDSTYTTLDFTNNLRGFSSRTGRYIL